jgi:hypothetical protein
VGHPEEYLRNAEAAQDWANKSTNLEDRERWLGLARSWLELFRSMTPSKANELSDTPSTKQVRKRKRPNPGQP